MAGSGAIGTVDVRIGARSSVALSFPATVAAPGARPLELVIDPDDAIPEDDESDNSVFVPLGDEHTLDLEIEAAVLSATEVTVGQPVTLTAQVRNRGTLDVPSVPLQLARESGTGASELARADVAYPPARAGA